MELILLLKVDLSFSKKILQGVHGGEVSSRFEMPSTVPGPFMFNHSYRPHLLLCLHVG